MDVSNLSDKQISLSQRMLWELADYKLFQQYLNKLHIITKHGICSLFYVDASNKRKPTVLNVTSRLQASRKKLTLNDQVPKYL